MHNNHIQETLKRISLVGEREIKAALSWSRGWSNGRSTMVGSFVKTTLGLALISATLATPAMARHNDGYYNNGYGYGNNDGYRNQGYDDRGYDNRGYDNRSYGYNNGYRCKKSGTGGLIIGAVAGGLLGRAVVGGRGDRTAGAIVGAGVGALAGRAIDRNGSNRC
jgi:hypothetical protein